MPPQSDAGQLREHSKSTNRPNTRIGDLSAMLRMMRPLHAAEPDPELHRRRLLADLCRLVGVSVGASEMKQQTAEQPAAPAQEPPAEANDLSPRLTQTLSHLLDGDSEKEIAAKMELSRHTIHVYVKSIYRKYKVSTRAELMARHLAR